jgi:thymidylate synthase (FAD)
MKIIDQSYQIKLLADFGPQSELIEDCGRVAYQSEDLINEESAPKFVKMIRDRNHGAVLEHSMMTVKFITDRGVSHELVRHRLASFTQESSRYCNYSKGKFDNQVTFIRPPWVTEKVLGVWGSTEGRVEIPIDLSNVDSTWFSSIAMTEIMYLGLLRDGWSPQQARSVLPNSLKTQIAVTTNFREWLHIFQLRAIEKTAHPQMRDLMIPLYQECRRRAPHLFDLGDPE